MQRSRSQPCNESPLSVGSDQIYAACMTDVRELYRTMALVRALNDDAIALARQGILHGYPPFTGQEAVQVGSAAAIDPRVDFAFPTYREMGAMIALGVDPVGLLAHHRGFGDGGVFDAARAHVAPMNAIVGGTVLHAVGWAMGAKLDGEEACALAYFGDGASSQGEVHEALNFAGVYRLPVVFLCTNNGWAISVRTEAQVAGGSVAARAAGYGMPGVRVDGNDVLAVHEATVAATQRARAGEGPTLIEAMTYRLGPHATSDDPSRYRDAAEEARARGRDPLVRARAALLASGEADDAFLAAVDAEVADRVREVRDRVVALEAPTFREQAALAYVKPPAAHRAQLETWMAEAAYA